MDASQTLILLSSLASTPIPHAALELFSSVCIDFAFVFTQPSDLQYSASFRCLREDPIINWSVSPLLSQEFSYLEPNFSFSVSVSVQSLFLQCCFLCSKCHLQARNVYKECSRVSSQVSLPQRVVFYTRQRYDSHPLCRPLGGDVMLSPKVATYPGHR